MNKLKLNIQGALKRLLRQHQYALLLRSLLSVLPLLSLSISLAWYYQLSTTLLFIASGLIIGASVLVTRNSRRYKAITPTNLLFHLNRQHPELEESAQLLLLPQTQLKLLQQLQVNKVQALLGDILQRTGFPWSRLNLPKHLVINLLSLVLLGLSYHFVSLVPDAANAPPVSVTNSAANLPATLLKAQVNITPPVYTKLPATSSTLLNLKVMAGAELEWLLQFDPQSAQQDYFLQFTDGQSHQFSYMGAQRYQVRTQVNQSIVYAIVGPDGPVDGFYTLAVVPDTAPLIRFIAPVLSTTELAKDSQAQLQVEVVISDDYGVTQAGILASIAKGSGEAVKFRDQQFDFDHSRLIEGKTHYYKQWQLAELGMEPGDEMYFHVIASDNRQPMAQQSRSPSKIVRWLDDEQEELVSEGLLQNIIPQYFKSQRQIIIETEQLIAGQTHLSQAQFKQTSQALGHAQSDLKRKYGEFLGDEFEGASLHTMETDPAIVQDHEQDHEHEAEQETPEQHTAQSQPQQQGHSHADSDSQTDKQDVYTQLINQYGHNHGEADLGYTGKTNQPSPVSLMKQAIANMWDAERHLLQSAPALALPFENAALKYLNQAKQAERIYVKRLGFEPPPVSESRRYQGELKDIVNLTQQSDSPLPASASKVELIRNTLQQLETGSLSSNKLAGLNLDAAQFSQLKQLFMDDIEQNPEAIRLVATLEQLQLDAKKLAVDCQSCIAQLQQQLWQKLPLVQASPKARLRRYLLANPALDHYQQFLQQEP